MGRKRKIMYASWCQRMRLPERTPFSVSRPTQTITGQLRSSAVFIKLRNVTTGVFLCLPGGEEIRRDRGGVADRIT